VLANKSSHDLVVSVAFAIIIPEMMSQTRYSDTGCAPAPQADCPARLLKMDLTVYIPAPRAGVGRLTRVTGLANLAKSLTTIDQFSGDGVVPGTAAGLHSTSLRHERTRT
jgi:hypothetical protein